MSLFGCFVETMAPFVNGTRVRLRISHNGAILEADGVVVYSRERAGMGIGFTSVEPSNASILNDWLTEMENRSDQQETDLIGAMKFSDWWH